MVGGVFQTDDVEHGGVSKESGFARTSSMDDPFKTHGEMNNFKRASLVRNQSPFLFGVSGLININMVFLILFIIVT